MKSGRESLAATVIHHSTPLGQRLHPTFPSNACHLRPSSSLLFFFSFLFFLSLPSPSKALMPSLNARKEGTTAGEARRGEGTKRGEKDGRRGWQQTPLMSQFRRSFSPSPTPLLLFSPPLLSSPPPRFAAP